MIPLYILAIEDDDDREFMSQLYLAYNRLMYNEIFKIIHDPWVTDDLLQTTLEKLIDKVQELRNKDREHLVSYIIVSCKNAARNFLRDKKRHPVFCFDEEIDWLDTSNDQEEIEFRLISEEELNTLVQIWPRLDERSRWILEMRYIHEKSTEEMASELGIKTGSARMLLSRAREKAFGLAQEQLNLKKRKQLSFLFLLHFL